MKIDLNMSDPLTLGLTLGIGHSVTQRIRRLTMRQTNKYMRGGTVMIIAAGLGLSSTAFSKDSSEPLKEAVKTVLETVEAPLVPDAHSTPKPMPQTPKKLAEALKAEAPATVRALSISTATSNLKPMRLRLNQVVSLDEIKRVEKFRQAWIDGDSDADRHLKLVAPDKEYKRMFQVSISDAGIASLTVSESGSGWPDPLRSNKRVWDTRELSTEMRRSLKGIFDTCASYSAPIYFEGNMFEGDADLAKGTFEVQCLPGREAVRNRVTDIELAHVYLKSEGLPLEKRQDYFQWKIGFAMMDEYVKNNPNATFQQDRAACVRMNTERKEKHAFTEAHKKAADHFLAKCDETDYNWVRKRLNLPEIAQ